MATRQLLERGKTSLQVGLLGVSILPLGCDLTDDDPSVAPGVAESAIGPEGGLVTSEDGVLTISIRPGALTETHLIVIEPSDEPPPVFSQAYRVRPNIPLAFAASVTFEHTLPEQPMIGAVPRAAYEAGEGEWVPLDNALVVTEQGRVTANDFELSVFYGLMDAAEP